MSGGFDAAGISYLEEKGCLGGLVLYLPFCWLSELEQRVC